MNKHHTIEEQYFDIRFSNESDAFEQQESLEAFVKQRLLPIVDSVFDEISGSGKLIRIDSIALDLGSVPYDDYEAETERCLREQLRNELLAYKLQIKKQPTSQASSISPQDSDLELLEYFLTTGCLHWSADSGSNLDLGVQLQELSEKRPRALKTLLKTVGKREFGVRRLIKQFSIAQLELLLGLFAPERSRAAINLYREFRIVLQARDFFAIPEHQLNELIWTELLTRAIQSGPNIAVNGGLVRIWLAGISDLVECSYSSLIGMLLETARKLVEQKEISIEICNILQCLDATKHTAKDAVRRQPVSAQSASQTKLTHTEDIDDSNFALTVNDYHHYLELKRRLIDTTILQEADPVRLTVGIKRLEQYAPWLLLRLALALKTQPGFDLHNFNVLAPEELEQLLKSLLVIFGIEPECGLAKLCGFTQPQIECTPDKTLLYARVVEQLIFNGRDGFDEFSEESEAKIKSKARAEAEAEPEAEVRAEPKSGAQAEPKESAQTRTRVDEEIGRTASSLSKNRLSDTEFVLSLEAYLNESAELSAREWVDLSKSIEIHLQRASLRLRRFLQDALCHVESRKRLIDLFPEVALVRSLAVLGVRDHAELLRCAESAVNLFRALDVGAKAAEIEVLKWQFIACYLFEEGRIFETQVFIRGLMVYLSEQIGVQISVLIQALKKRTDLDRLPEMLRLRQPVLDALTRSKPVSDLPPVVSPQSTLGGGDTEELEVSENIYIHNAGLVLAAPYIPRLLDMLNLTADSEFKNRNAAERGIHLLQYLVNGSCSSPEYQLVLNKILCGVTTGTPIVREIAMDDNEAAVVETLLQAIIEHWTAIGSTSIAGLQESFLQREGRLRLKNDSWHLLVEARAFDMLLDRLPWSFSLIKFPWMLRPIHVEWR